MCHFCTNKLIIAKVQIYVVKTESCSSNKIVISIIAVYHGRHVYQTLEVN